jgi:hypothetical protein
MKLPIPDGLSALIQPLRVPLWLRLRRAAIFCSNVSWFLLVFFFQGAVALVLNFPRPGKTALFIFASLDGTISAADPCKCCCVALG